MARYPMTRANEMKFVTVNEGVNISQKNHDKLVDEITKRLKWVDGYRNTQIARYEEIDRMLAGFVNYSEEDKKRKRDNRQGRKLKPVDVNLPLTAMQLDEVVTFLVGVLIPDSGMYKAIAPKARIDVAKSFSALMNKHGSEFGHFTQYVRAIYDMLRYNEGGWFTHWERVYGNQIVNKDDGSAGVMNQLQSNYTVQSNQITQAGNCIKAIDPYNFVYDISKPVYKLWSHGEFAGSIDVLSHFDIEKMHDDGQLYNCDWLKKQHDAVTTYYKFRPEIVDPYPITSGTGQETNWFNIFRGMGDGKVGKGYEYTDFFWHVRPREFGLGKSNKLEIWHFVLMCNKYICLAKPMTDAHGRLPVSAARPWDDGFKQQSKTLAELLIPLQIFASYQMNVHQRSARKKLYGQTWYDETVIDMKETEDMESAQIPVKKLPKGAKISDHVYQTFDGPDTQKVLEDINFAIDVMQRILPSNIQRQVADLQRATQYQAAALVQGSNKRNYKLARIINDQAFIPGRMLQMMNIFQYQESMNIIDPMTGQEMQINPAQFRSSSLTFDVADGLKGLDQIMYAEALKDVINMLLQSQQAQEVDVLKLIDYYTSLMGDKLNFMEFKKQYEWDKLTPEQKQQAWTLLQTQAQAANVQRLQRPAGSP